MPDRSSSYAGCLLGAFAGDALGAVWEGSGPATDVAAAHDRLSWSAARDGVLRHTDDVQLTLALARHLLDDPRCEDQQGWVGTILDAHEPDRGYGGGFRRLVSAWRDGADVRSAATSVFPDGSWGNGAAMRVTPAALRWPDDADARATTARNQALVSHAHPVGIDGALVVAEAVAVALREAAFGPEEAAEAARAARTPAMRDALTLLPVWVGRWRDDRPSLAEVADGLGTTVVAERSVPAALWAAVVGEDLVEAIALAVGLGGDADTIACMAGAIRGAADGRDAVPVSWVVAMEDGPRGVTHALDLADRLAATP